MKSLMEWYILHSLHSKLLTTVSSNSTFHKHGIFFPSLIIFFNKTVAVHCRVGLGRTGSVAICWKSSDSQQARLRVGHTCRARGRKTTIAYKFEVLHMQGISKATHYLLLFDLNLTAHACTIACLGGSTEWLAQRMIWEVGSLSHQSDLYIYMNFFFFVRTETILLKSGFTSVFFWIIVLSRKMFWIIFILEMN